MGISGCPSGLRRHLTVCWDLMAAARGSASSSLSRSLAFHLLLDSINSSSFLTSPSAPLTVWLLIAPTATNNQASLAFIARASGAGTAGTISKKKAWLQESIEFVARTHSSIYGQPGGGRSPQFHVFVHQSNVPFFEGGATFKLIRSIISRGQRENSEIIFVISGWDGLTTHSGTFGKVFKPCIEDPTIRCRIRVYADEPRSWFDVNIVQAVALWVNGELDWNRRDLNLDWHTELFCRNVQLIREDKQELSESFQRVSFIHRFHRSTS